MSESEFGKSLFCTCEPLVDRFPIDTTRVRKPRRTTPVSPNCSHDHTFILTIKKKKMLVEKQTLFLFYLFFYKNVHVVTDWGVRREISGPLKFLQHVWAFCWGVGFCPSSSLRILTSCPVWEHVHFVSFLTLKRNQCPLRRSVVTGGHLTCCWRLYLHRNSTLSCFETTGLIT